ncbi:MAG TPA: SDR family oxidoreductase [Pirellulales bacterium]|jgi:3-oxoacyl-[acyl-carrier protein] reductase|nr:SDR family oxidoreductase [Pirellulales bacterium]
MSSSAPPLTGLSALVTGATSGIGRATAVALAAAGASVLVHGRRADAAEAVAAELRASGAQADVLLADVADPAQREQLVEQAWQRRGSIDIWFNNAGADVLTGPPAGWPFERKLALLWQVDVCGTMHLSRLIGARMQERSAGAIINMGWDQAELGMAGDSGELFAATKGAVMAFSKSLAQSLAPHVRVNCVAPGWIRTAWGQDASEAWQQRARRESLLDRWGTPEDVARVVCFLASPAAGFITGQVLPVNGGLRRT